MPNMEDRIDTMAAAQGRERIIEILVFLLTEMRAKKALTEIDLKPLSQRGYSQTEISAAFSWLFDKLAAEQPAMEGPVVFAAPANTRPVSSYRFYHEAERSVLSTEARGYMMQLHELGLLSDVDLELIIDRVMMAGVPSVNLSDIQELITSSVLGTEEFRQHNRMLLGASDRIQ